MEAIDADVKAAADRAAAELRAGITAIPDPEPMSVFDHVYAEPNSHLDRQKARFGRYLAMFDDEDGGRR